MIQTSKSYTKELAQNIADCLAEAKTKLPAAGSIVIPGTRVYHTIEFCGYQQYRITFNIPN